MATTTPNGTPADAKATTPAKPGDAAPNAAPPRDRAAVAPEATAAAARETTPAKPAPAAAKPRKAPAKTSGPTPESRRKAARRTTASTRRPKTASTSATRRAAATRAAAEAVAAPARPALAAAPSPAAAEAAGERTGHAFARLNADVAAAGRTVGRTVVDAVEGAGDRLATYQEQLAASASLPWVADLARANAELTRAATRVYAGTARTLLRD